MSDHTPTTAKVRDSYAARHISKGVRATVAKEEFDAWLTEHDAKVRAEAQEATIQADADTLAAEIHEAWEFQYDECDHGTYAGGHLNGEPYAMCRLSAERIVRRRAADREPSDAEVRAALSEWYRGMFGGGLTEQGEARMRAALLAAQGVRRG